MPTSYTSRSRLIVYTRGVSPHYFGIHAAGTSETRRHVASFRKINNVISFLINFYLLSPLS
jgi:hypothetical protein